jgi:hypothetical protein
MKRIVASVLCGSALLWLGAPEQAHHSFAMFDQEHPIQPAETVKEFRYTSPHSLIILEVKGQDGGTVLWNLEGGAPSGLVRDGWTSKTIKLGDELELTIDPLRSGAPAGAWNVNKVKFKDGHPIAATH